MLVKSSSLSPAERLTVYRRRLDLTQEQAARKFRTTLSVYRRWEAVGGGPRVPLGVLATNEECFVLRRRHRLRQAQVAKAVGICCTWLRAMEFGEVPADRLVAYWSKRAA